MSSPCKSHVSKMIGLVSGSLHAHEANKLRQHLNECPECARALQRLVKISELCRSLGQEPPKNLPWRQIEAQIYWKLAQNRPAPRTWRWVWGAGALALATTAGIIVGILIIGRSAPPREILPLPSFAEIPAKQVRSDEELTGVVTLVQGEVFVRPRLGRDQRLEMSRPLLQGDGLHTEEGRVACQWAERSGMLLSSHAAVELRQLRNAGQEIVLERGLAFFQVNKLRSEQRFEVLAGEFSAVVKGTYFSVALNSDVLDVAVYEGTVTVEPLDHRWSPLEIPSGYSSRIARHGLGRPSLRHIDETPDVSLLNLQAWPSFQRMMADTGLLSLESSPAGADVKWDTLMIGTTNLTLRSTLGSHLVEYWRDGTLLKRQWVEVHSNEGHFTLRPRPKAKQASQLPEGFQDLIRQRSVQIQACYERQLKQRPELEGNFIVKITIDKEGKVTQAALVKDTFPDPSVGQCALSMIQRWLFPPGHDVELVYPFLFRPR